MTRKLKLDPTTLKFSESDQLTVISVTGAGRQTRLESFVATCGGTCKATVTFPKNQALTQGKKMSGSISYTDSTATINATRTTYSLVFINPVYGYEDPTFSSAPYRCDRRVGKYPGCVFHQYKPTLTTMTLLPEIRKNIQGIQKAGPHHYGSKSLSGGKYPLSRSTLATLQRANRRVACPANRTRPTKMQCDEYPFAATNEGASKTTPPDWGWAWVPEKEQQRQGGLLSTFYQDNRVLNGDKYWVAV